MYSETHHTHHRLTHEQFRIELAKGLLLSASVDLTGDMPRTSGPATRSLPPAARLTERHFPTRLADAESQKRQSNCIICSGKKGRGRKTTTYMCKQCHLPMCVVPCFELYHTKVDPERYLWGYTWDNSNMEPYSPSALYTCNTTCIVHSLLFNASQVFGLHV